MSALHRLDASGLTPSRARQTSASASPRRHAEPNRDARPAGFSSWPGLESASASFPLDFSAWTQSASVARSQETTPASPLKALERQARQNAKAGSAGVAIETTTLVDEARGGREVRMRLYLPENTNGKPAPLVMLSHGLGGTEKTLGYLAQHLASQGYAVAALRHPGADVDAVNQNQSATFQQRLEQQGVSASILERLKADDGQISGREFAAAMSKEGVSKSDILKARQDAFHQASDDLLYHQPQQWADRPRDVSFALDQLQQRAQTDPAFAAKIDFDKIAAAGHSYGSYTSLALAGASVNMPEGGMTNFRDERVDAAFILSPIGVKEGKGPFTADSYQSVATPVFAIAGSEEDPTFRSMPVRLGPEDRHDSYMLILEGRHHNSFGNHGDAKTHEIINGTASTFLNAVLKQSPQDLEVMNNLPLGDSTYLSNNPFFRR